MMERMIAGHTHVQHFCSGIKLAFETGQFCQLESECEINSRWRFSCRKILWDKKTLANISLVVT